MTVVGNAYVAVTPLSTGFGTKLEAELATSGFGGNIEKQMANAGVLGGNAFTKKIHNALSIAGLSGGQALGAGIALGAVAGLAAIGEEFQKAEHQIAQQTGATGKTLSGLADTVTRSFRQVPVSLSAAATAVDELFRRGVPLGPQLDQLAKQELFLAKVTKEDLGSTVEATTGLMQKFNVPLADQSRELDVLFKAYQASGKGLSELTSNLQTAGGILQSFGFSLDKSAALLSSLERAGVNLGPALAGLRLAFGKIVAEGGDPQKVLAALIKEFTDGTPKAKAMADAIQLFGKRSGAELSIAISKGKFDVDALLKTITNGRDGIIATGLATLTLGDQIRLFANNAQADLSKIGTSVLQGLEKTFADVGPPIGQLIVSLGRLVESAAPAGVVFLPLIEALRAVGPIVSVFAEGVKVIADGLDALPGPVAGTIVVLAGLAIAGQSIAASFAIATDATIALGVSLNLAFPQLKFIAAAIATIGIVAKLTATSIDPAVKIAKDFGNAAFDAGNKAGVFKDGISSAGAAVKSFLADQASAGKLSSELSSGLTTAGSNVKQLGGAVAGTSAQWNKYRDSVIAAAKAADPINNANELGSASVQKLTFALDDQRQAFETANKAELTQAVVLGQISPKLETHIKNLHRSKDGTVDFGAAVDDLNKRLASQAAAHDTVILAADSTAVAEEKLAKQLAAGTISEAEATSALKALGLTGTATSKELDALKDTALQLNQAQDQMASSVVPATAAYGDLTRQIAQGTITQHDAVAQLHAMGFSLAGAGTAFTDLSGQVKSFIDGAVSQLPTVGQAISDFAQQITTDQQQLDSDKQSSVDLNDKLNKAIANSSASTQQKLATINLTIVQDQQKIALGSVSTTDKLQRDLLRRSQILAGSGKASATLRDEVAANNAAIIADMKKLADDNNPNKFTQNLLDNAVKIAAFTANLQKLVNENLAPLAAELAKQGPAAAAGLAAGLAASPAKAAIAEKAVELGKTASDNFRKFLEDNAPELIGTGAKQGLVIGKAIADGITKELLNNFPFLRQLGITTGDQLLAGTKEGAGKGDPTELLAAAVRTHIPEFRGLGIPVGSAVNQGVAEGAGRADVMGGIAKQLSRADQFSAAGVAMGAAIDEGISAGVILNQSVVGGALITMTQYGTSVVANQWRIKSPSQVFAAIGREVPAGVAAGITSNLAVIGTALSGIHASGATIIRQLSQDGFNVGVAAAGGIADGIRSQFDNVGGAVLAITEHGVAVAKGAWKVTSPSKVFAEIGSQVGAGLAEGITTSAASVGSAASRLANATTASVRAALAGVTFDPTVQPVITPKVAQPVVPPIPEQLFAGRVDAVTVPPVPTLSLSGVFADVAPPSVPSVSVHASLLPIPTPEVQPITIAATVRVPPEPINVAGRVVPTVPALSPVRLDAVVAPPVIAPVEVPARFGTLAAPEVEPVVLRAAFGNVRAPSLAPVTLDVSVPDLPRVVLPGTVDVAPPRVDRIIVPAGLGPIPEPRLPRVVVQTELERIKPEDLPPVVIPSSLARPAAPDVPHVVVPASLGSVAPPRLLPVTISAQFGPVPPPSIPAVSLDVRVPPQPEVALRGTVSVSAAPRVPDVVVPASLAPLPTPSIARVTVQTTLAPLVQPTVDPVVIGSSLVPPAPPVVAPIVIAAALSPIPAPRITPVVAPVSVPPLDPVVIDASLSPLVVPPLAPIRPEVEPLPPFAAPVVPPVVIAASLSHVEVPRIAPVVAPVVVPPIAPVTVQAALSSLVVPPLPPAIVTVAPLSVPPIPPVVVPTSLSQVESPHVSPVTISATIDAKVPPIDATAAGRRLGETVASGVSDGIESSTIADRLTTAATTAAATASSSFRDAGSLLGSQLTSSVNGQVVDPDKTPGQGLVTGFDANAGVLRAHMSDLQKFLDGFTFVGQLEHQFAAIKDQATTAGFVTFAAGLVDTFHTSFQKISVDATQLQTVLDALTEQRTARASALSTELLDKLQAEKLLTTKFAPPQPPSNVTFKQDFQSLPVPRPQDRADAQTPRPPIVFEQTFNEKIDPLHVAAEIAWQLL